MHYGLGRSRLIMSADQAIENPVTGSSRIEVEKTRTITDDGSVVKGASAKDPLQDLIIQLNGLSEGITHFEYGLAGLDRRIRELEGKLTRLDWLRGQASGGPAL